MTLTRRTIIIVVFALILIFISMFLIAVQNNRTYFTKQLEINAVDTSTSLGLTISSKIQSVEDKTMILSIINAAFDRGHFKKISMCDNDGALVASRYFDNAKINVPDWFIKSFPIKTNSKSAIIMHGWRQLGTINVESDANIVYLALWDTAKDLFVFFLAVTILITLLTVLLIKITFKPLNTITKQAEDISKKNLYVLAKVPKLLELKILAETMNSMVLKLKEYFTAQIREVEKLRVDVYQDPLTGNGNRRYFFGVFNQYLSDGKNFLPGYLLLLKVSGLLEYNKQYGYQSGDQLLRDISVVLDSFVGNKYKLVLARLDNPSFAIVFLGQDKSKMDAMCSNICTQINSILDSKESKMLRVGIGIVKCNFGDIASNLLSAADGLTENANSQTQCYYSIQEDTSDVDIFVAWRSKIIDAISDKKFNFYMQPIKSVNVEHHNECFIKLVNKDGSEISAAYFFPIVDEYGLGGSIDRLVVQEVLKYGLKGLLAINLSRETLLDADEQAQFLQLLQGLDIPDGLNLCFEFTEAVLDENISLVKSFIVKLQGLGFAVGLDQVGIILAPLGYLSEINLAYLKLAHSFTKNIEKNKENRDLICKWIDLVATLDLALIATAVETESQWSCLRGLGVTYFQGNYIQAPRIVG